MYNAAECAPRIPPAWVVVHEMNIDPAYRLDADALIPDGAAGALARLVRKARERESAARVGRALLALHLSGASASAGAEETVTRELAAVSKAIAAQARLGDVAAALDGRLLCQMVRTRSIDAGQLCALLGVIGDALEGGSIVASSAENIAEWKRGMERRIRTAETLALLRDVVPDMLRGAVELAVRNGGERLTVRLRLAGAGLRDGLQFEREQAIAAIASGALPLVRTTRWLDAAHRALLLAGGAPPTGEAVVAAALLDTVRTAALDDARWVRAASLPEILTLDAARVRRLRDALRRAAIAASLRVAADLPPAAQLDLWEDLGDCRIRIETVESVPRIARAAAMDSSRGSLRELITNRAAAALEVAVQGGDLARALRRRNLGALHAHLAPAEAAARRLIDHTAAVYAPVISAILASRR